MEELTCRTDEYCYYHGNKQNEFECKKKTRKGCDKNIVEPRGLGGSEEIEPPLIYCVKESTCYVQEKDFQNWY